MTLEKLSVLALNGKLDRIGSRGATFAFDDPAQKQDSRGIGDLDQRSAANFLVDWLDKQIGLRQLSVADMTCVPTSSGSIYLAMAGDAGAASVA